MLYEPKNNSKTTCNFCGDEVEDTNNHSCVPGLIKRIEDLERQVKKLNGLAFTSYTVQAAASSNQCQNTWSYGGGGQTLEMSILNSSKCKKQ